MKSLKKIATILLVVALLATLLAIAVAAEGETEYTGTVDAATELLDKFDQAANAAARKTRLKAVEDYFTATPIDPASEGYVDLVKRTVNAYLTVFNELSATDFASMLKYRNGLDDFVTNHPVDLGTDLAASVAGVKTTYAERVVSKARSLISDYEAAKTTAAKFSAVSAINVHFLNYFVGMDCDDYDELMNSAANAYMGYINEDISLSLKKKYLKSLNDFMKADPEVTWTATTNNNLRTTKNAYNAKYEEIKESLLANAPLSEYSSSYLFCDFTGGAKEFSYAYKRTYPVEVLLGDSLDPENKSMTVTADGTDQTYFHITIPAEVRAQVSVLEFDFLAETECSGYLALQAKDSNGFPSLCNIGPTGIGAAASKSLISGEYFADAFVVGEWIHVSIVVDALNDKVYVYVDYQYAGCNSKQKFDDLEQVRFDGYMKGTYKVDNIMFYAGTTPRDVNRLENYTDAERFQFYASFLDKINDNDLLPSINIAYNEMTTALPLYWDAANSTYTDAATTQTLKDAVDAYRGFDYDAFNTLVKAYNLDVLTDYMNQFYALGRDLTNITSRSAMITFIRTFMAMNIFDKENASYKTFDATLTAEARNTELDANINVFINAMSRFKLAPVITTMEKYYNQAHEFVKTSSLDLTVLDDANYTAFKEAYEVYLDAATRIDAVRRDAASKRFVTYMNYLTKFNGYDKESVWIENYATFDQYITACRAILRSDGYNPEYEGWAEALELYNLINDYLYEDLQQTHLKEAIAMLDRFPESDSYVSKLGVCRYVRNYFANNDVDYTHPEIAAAVTRLQIYEDEVAILAQEYAVVLEQNTQEFISYVQQMKSTKDYSDLKAIYNASLDYYYSMNIDSDEAVAALADFDVFSDKLIVIEQSSAAFVETASGISNLTGEKLYDALVKCYGLFDNVSSDIAGVSDAITAYEAALAEYEAQTVKVNSELSSVSVVICAVRYSPAVKPVAAVIKKIFE